MRYFQPIAAGVDVVPVALDLARAPHLWNRHPWRTQDIGSPHRHADDIWLRYNDCAPFVKGDRPWSEFNDEHVPIWYPALQSLPSVRPIIFNLMRRVEGERLGGVLITRVPAGRGIDRHVDRGWHVETYDKYYLSIAAPASCTFHAGSETIVPRVGDVWWFDNRVEHWVENPSHEDRITLIVCIQSHKEPHVNP